MLYFQNYKYYQLGVGYPYMNLHFIFKKKIIPFILLYYLEICVKLYQQNLIFV